MQSVDRPSIWAQRGPLEPPVTLGFWAPCKKHRLKIADMNDMQYMIVFLCQNCDWVVVCRRVLLRHMVLGNVGWVSGDNPEGDLVYRAWNSEGEGYGRPRDTQDAARTTPGCGERSD